MLSLTSNEVVRLERGCESLMMKTSLGQGNGVARTVVQVRYISRWRRQQRRFSIDAK